MYSAFGFNKLIRVREMTEVAQIKTVFCHFNVNNSVN